MKDSVSRRDGDIEKSRKIISKLYQKLAQHQKWIQHLPENLPSQVSDVRLLEGFDGIQPAGRSGLSTDHEDQSEVSEEGYIMDMSLVAKLIDNFDSPGREKGLKNIKDGQLNDFYASIRLDHKSTLKLRKLPTFLDMGNLGTYCIAWCSVVMSDVTHLFHPQPAS